MNIDCYGIFSFVWQPLSKYEKCCRSNGKKRLGSRPFQQAKGAQAHSQINCGKLPRIPGKMTFTIGRGELHC